MPTPLDFAARSAAAAAEQLAAAPIEYQRGEWSTRAKPDGQPLTALAGRDDSQRLALAGRGAMSSTRRAWPWLIRPADLVDDAGAPLIPQPGDRLTVWPDDADRAATYVVVADKTEPAWTWSGPHKIWRRLRTEAAT